MDLELLEHLKSFLTERRQDLFRQVLHQRTRHFTVVTEDVYQLHNTSAVIRSCDIFGIQDMHVVEERLGKKLDREIAMGAQKWVNTQRHQNVSACITQLRKSGYRIIATTPHYDTQLLEDFEINNKAAFFFGTESEGVSEEVMKRADEFLKIPMYGFTESLNISVSVAIILQEVVTRLRRSEIPWQLSEEEKLIIELDWTKKTIKSAEEIIGRFYDGKR